MQQEHITSRRNPLLVHVRRLLTSRSYRAACGEFAADGCKLLQEAARWYPGLHTVIAEDDIELCQLNDDVCVVRVPKDVMQSVSQMDAPQGAVFVCAMPQPCAARIAPGTLLLDGVQDPGNVGTILRTADALEVPVVLLGGCADPYNPKTVRASMGAVFRTQPVSMTAAQAVEACRAAGVPLIAAAMHTQARDLRELPLGQAAVVIGSEGQGVSPQMLEACGACAVIPMSPRCESLNAAIAAAIVMWQMKR